MVSIYRLTVSEDTPWQRTRAEQLTEQLLSAFPDLNFRIVATSGHIEWQLLDPRGRAQPLLERVIQATYPQVLVEPRHIDLLRIGRRPVYRYVAKYQMVVDTFLAPILDIRDIKEADSDPLSTLVQAMSGLQMGERISYMIAVCGAANDAYKAGAAQIYRTVYDGLLSLAFPRREPRYESPVQRVLEEKLQSPLYRCLVTIEIDSPHQRRLAELALIDATLTAFARLKFNKLQWYQDGSGVIRVETDIQDRDHSALTLVQAALQPRGASRETLNQLREIGLVLTPREIAALWHLPHAGFTTSDIAWSRRQAVPLTPNAANQQNGLRLGYGLYRGQPHPALLPNAVRTAHVSIVGKTRTGKSNLLHHLIHQDIEAGRGVTVIDPHGNLIQDILRASIPTGREDDVVLLDIADTNHPPALNLLTTAQADKSITTAGELATVLGGIYGDMSGTPRTKNALRSALATIWHDDNPTLVDVTRLFEDRSYRAQLTQRLGIENLQLIQFWNAFDAESAPAQDQVSGPVKYRMQALYGNPILLPILCHPQHIDFSTLIAQNKIILVLLAIEDKKVPKEDKNLVGAIVVATLLRSAENRVA